MDNRVNADFEELSPFLVNALVATEDARFFKHGGVDFRAWIRVFFRTILMRDHSGGGGSTISQQLAKNLFPRKDFGFLTIPVVKIREMFIARRLEKLYDKPALLNLYLNTVSFSENIFGVKVAAQRFFNTSPKNIKPEQAAVLVGMLKGTNYYNPLKHPDRARERRNTVLRQMVKYGYLEPAVCDSLAALPLELKYYREGSNQGLATSFREHLRLEVDALLKDVEKPNGQPYNLYTDGLKIYTTLNASLQQYAEEAVKEHLSRLQATYFKHWKNGKSYGDEALFRQARQQSRRYKSLHARGLSDEKIDEIFDTPVAMTIYDSETLGEKDTLLSPNDSIKYYLSILNVGMLVLEPNTGKTLAWVGSVNHKYFKYDHVKARRQAGSTFKPVVFAKALESGIPPCEYIDNFRTRYTQFENWEPRNADGKYGGMYSMEGALSHSVNVVTVELMNRVGIDSVIALARRLGIEGDIPEVPSLCLGTLDVSLLEMVRLYATFANRGARPDMYYLKRIENADGEVLVDLTRPDTALFEQVLSPRSTDMLVRMLESVVDSGTARRLRYQFHLREPIAGKTGTTQHNSDGWFIGFTPRLVAGVWVGGESPKIRFRSTQLGQGSNTALPVFGRFLRKVYRDPDFKDLRKARFPTPDSLTLAELDCPPWLPDRSYLDPPETEFDLFDLDWIRGVFDADKTIDRARKKHSSGGTNERIRRHNEQLERRRERKKKRKKFWDKLRNKND
ncbi:MAG: penicillin-binding protein [Bacteroidetes bacterium]|nr:MAG: penicillin-binding protein [Bacteroidota bacterium]